MYFICSGSLPEMRDSLSLNYKIGLYNRGSDGQSRLENFSENEFWQVTKRTCAGMNWCNLFSSGISTDGATKALVKLLQRNLERTQVNFLRHSFSCHSKTLEGRGLIGRNNLEHEISRWNFLQLSWTHHCSPWEHGSTKVPIWSTPAQKKLS